MTTINRVANAVLKSQKSSSTSAYDTSATVTRVTDDAVFVHIDGGVPETPCQKTIDCKAGDVVKIRISGGKAWITGNATAPPTDDARAITAQNTAQKADEKAITAQETTDQEIIDRKAIIREYEDGVLVAKQNNNYGALINASGSFDVVQLTWSGREPVIGNPVARFGTVAKIGNDEKSYVSIDYRSFKLVDGRKNPEVVYMHVSNLLDSDDNITDYYVGDGSRTMFYYSVSPDRSSTVTVTVNDVDVTNSVTISQYNVIFSSAPENNALIEIKYKPHTLDKMYAFTFGTRKDNYNIGLLSFAEGYNVIVDGKYSHAEGEGSRAGGIYAHAEGKNTISNYRATHAEGESTIATDRAAHAEGYKSEASGSYSHAEGEETRATAQGSHAEGYKSEALGMYSHTQNTGTMAGSDNQTVIGKYNINDSNDEYAFIVGKGTSDNSRSNALTVDWSGNVSANGTFNVAGSIKRKTYTWTISSIGANEYKSTEVSPPSESGYTPIGIIGHGIFGTGTSSAQWIKCHIRPSDDKLVIGIKNDNATASTDWEVTVYILYAKS